MQPWRGQPQTARAGAARTCGRRRRPPSAPDLSATSPTASRLPRPTSGWRATTCAAKLTDGDFERGPRSQGRFLEQHRDVLARRARPRSAPRDRAGGRPSRCAARSRQRSRSAGSRSRIDRKSFRIAALRLMEHDSGPIVRVDPDVVGAQVAGPRPWTMRCRHRGRQGW